MEHQLEEEQRFRNFPYALYALDVKFQPAFRPGGRFNEKKHYFSGKHKLYGYKVECAVALPGIAVHVSKHYTGAVSDLSIALDNKSKHASMLAKAQDEDRDFGEGSDVFPSSWAVLVDKGYQGLQTTMRAIYPTKKPRGGELSVEAIERNTKVSSDRVIVENYFGRVCGLWRTMSSTFSWSESRYDQLVNICFALTNFHASLYPLRAGDSNKYKQQLARYVSMAQQDAKKRSRAAVLAKARKAARSADMSPYSQQSIGRTSSNSAHFSPSSCVDSQIDAYSQDF
jgi:hypothetical protein